MTSVIEEISEEVLPQLGPGCVVSLLWSPAPGLVFFFFTLFFFFNLTLLWNKGNFLSPETCRREKVLSLGLRKST